MYDSFIGAYKGLFRFIGYAFLVVGAIAVTVALAILGVGIDFNNSFGKGGEGTMYMFMLPFAFIVFMVWLAYTSGKRRRAKRIAAQESQIRQKIVREHQYGATPQQQIIYILEQQGPQTSRQLATACGISDEDMIEMTRSLLAEQLVHQIVQDGQPYLVANE